jgi:hypothetical protein
MSLKDQLAQLGMIEEDGNSSSSVSSSRRAWEQEEARARSPQRERQTGTRPERSSRAHKSGRNATSRGEQPRASRPARAPRPVRELEPLDLSPEERTTRTRELLKRARLPFPPSGSNRFYYELRGGVIDFLETDQGSHDALSSGQIVVVANERGKSLVIDRKSAQELRRIDPEWIPRSR